MNLFKALDSLSHQLLIAKLKACGLAEEAVKLLESYIWDSSQQIKLGTFTTESLREIGNLYNRVPRGSILGPLLLYMFINDTFYSIVQSIYITLQRTVLYVTSIQIINTILKSILEKESNILISWFSDHFMKANPDKFQVIGGGKKLEKRSNISKLTRLISPVRKML